MFCKYHQFEKPVTHSTGLECYHCHKTINSCQTWSTTNSSHKLGFLSSGLGTMNIHDLVGSSHVIQLRIWWLALFSHLLCQWL